ncbi:hypothetical protein RF11_01228 [Thelohanellus kitauei]|uniref:Uncharacterized protein n=1 Tax=Thelohanellus kitauei TaxID=669202 RepID=A0A0C2JZ99_THEKT|nr:hypothetical protein RF11_01228 [Thelohanellus kitauei]
MAIKRSNIESEKEYKFIKFTVEYLRHYLQPFSASKDDEIDFLLPIIIKWLDQYRVEHDKTLAIFELIPLLSESKSPDLDEKNLMQEILERNSAQAVQVVDEEIASLLTLRMASLVR